MSGRRILHAIHDFLPRHAAGSEIYAFALARQQREANTVWVLAAEYDPVAAHGSLRWRDVGGVPVAELVNNWAFSGFAESFASPRINTQIQHVLDVVRPDVVHVHNLLNLSLDLPRLSRASGARVVATVHDYTLACPSGGQRVHRAEHHLCAAIEPQRCARCFPQSPFAGQMAGASLMTGRAGPMVGRVAHLVRRVAPASLAVAAQGLPRPTLTSEAISERLQQARAAYGVLDLVVFPSASIAGEFARLGFRGPTAFVSDNGFALAAPWPRPAAWRPPLRIGYVGSIVWHKGVHVLLEAAAQLRGGFAVVIAGSQDVAPDYVTTLKRLAGRLPVAFTGAFGQDEVPRLYAGLDVLVVPSLWLENSPLVIHEAFAHGVAVVASDIGGIPELVRHDNTGLLVESGSAPALAAALQRLLDDPLLCRRLAAAAPAVKSIVEDAAAWEERYASLATGDSSR